MCIIVDTDRLGIFLKSDHEDSIPIWNWLNRGGRIIYSDSGKFEKEIIGYKRKLEDLVRAGQARLVPSQRFSDDEEALKDSDELRSDDPHVLALARYAAVRLLYTGETDLKKDFKNKKLIDKPRGKIYSGKRNKQLLQNWVCER